jgi:selenide,water dikinase
MKRLVLLGGGHSHIEVLRRFAAQPPARTEVVLADRARDFAYSGMLPGWIAGHYARSECHVDLESLARLARCRYVPAACRTLDLAVRVVSCDDGTALPFDLLSVDTGAGSPAERTEGAAVNTLAIRPVEAFVARWSEMQHEIARGQGPRTIAMVGAGAAGVEVVLAMQHRLRKRASKSNVAFHLVGDSDEILAGHNDRVRDIFMRVLAERGVALHLGRAVECVQRGRLRLVGGTTLDADAIVWATGPAAPSWPKLAGLAVDARGFILVDSRLQSQSHSGVFAAGDIASIPQHPRPKNGVYAVRAGPPLAANLRRALAGQPLVAWTPQKHALALISTGDRYAVASRGGLALEGAWVWRWKDWIDRRFVRRYRVPVA